MVGEQQAAVLAEGAAILGRVLEPQGFAFVPRGQGKGSGGPAAWGSFSKGAQRLEFHFRYSLGLVSYNWDDVTLSHQDYLRGLDQKGSYPGFSDDPLQGFRHLAADLAGPLKGFVVGDRKEFDQAVKAATSTRPPRLP